MKNLIKVILFLFIVCVIMYVLSPIFKPVWETDVILNGLSEEKKNSIDVLFVGDSDIYEGISPLEIYKNSGVTSYNYASSKATNLLMYHMMKRALTYQTPKLIVMDVSSVFGYKEGEENTHRAIDATPLDDIKMELINDKSYNFSIGDKLLFIFPYLRFHDRWKELNSSDLNKKHAYNRLKGYMFQTDVKTVSNDNTYMNDNNETIDFSFKSLPKAILRTKKYCDANNIKFLLLAMPDVTAWSYAKYERLTEWTKKNNIDYLDINVLLKEVGINFDTDSKDNGMHLNIYGATKLSKYISNYFKKNYNLKDHRNDDYYKNWDEDLNFYEELLKENNVQI